MTDRYLEYCMSLLILSVSSVLLASRIMPVFHRQAVSHMYRIVDISRELNPPPSAIILEFKKRA